jgi:hypothetical protein
MSIDDIRMPRSFLLAAPSAISLTTADQLSTSIVLFCESLRSIDLHDAVQPEYPEI